MGLALPGMWKWEPGRQIPPDGINAGGSGGELLSPGSIHPFLSNGCAHQLWLPTSVIFLCYKLDSTACGQGAITSPLKRNFFSQGLNFLKSWGNCSLRKWDGLSWSVPDGGGGVENKAKSTKG